MTSSLRGSSGSLPSPLSSMRLLNCGIFKMVGGVCAVGGVCRGGDWSLAAEARAMVDTEPMGIRLGIGRGADFFLLGVISSTVDDDSGQTAGGEGKNV